MCCLWSEGTPSWQCNTIYRQWKDDHLQWPRTYRVKLFARVLHNFMVANACTPERLCLGSRWTLGCLDKCVGGVHKCWTFQSLSPFDIKRPCLCLFPSLVSSPPENSCASRFLLPPPGLSISLVEGWMFSKVVCGCLFPPLFPFCQVEVPGRIRK